MAYAKLLLVLALAAWANGHSYFSSITIDGVAMKEDDCMRPHPSSKYDYPISALDNPNGLQSQNMICGWLPNAGKPANRKCPVKPGSTVTLQWHYERGLGSSDDFYIDPSHKGPCIVYMAKSETGSGNVWFKIFEDGYDSSSKKWCVTRMRENGGKFTVTIPTDIQPGNYLFRGELIALHEGHEMYGAQPYVGCAEMTVSGSGTVDPPNKVTFPGAYKATDAGIFFNPYRSFSSYPIPGPAKYVSGSAPAVGGSSSSSSSTTGSRSTSTSTSTTGRATSTSTTGRATSTSGKVTSTSTSTTGQKTSTSTSGSSSSSGSYNNPTGSCTLGEQVCTGDATYKTCGWVGNGVAGWGTAQQNCPSGLKCHAVQDKYVWCY